MDKMCSEITLLTLWRLLIIRKRYIHIILDLAWPKYIKSTLEQEYIVSILHSQLTRTDGSIGIGLASASKLSGLLPLRFLVVISEMHKDLWGSSGLVWFTNCMHSKYLVRKVCHANYRGMVSSVEIGGIVIVNGTTLFHTRSNPGCSLKLASISSSTGYTTNTMSADALAALEARASAVVFLIPKPEYFFSSIKKS